MPHYVSMDHGAHRWQKKNNVTISSPKGGYDIYHCDCGAKGRSYQLGQIQIDGRVAKWKVDSCPEQSIPQLGRVRITNFTGFNPSEFGKIIRGSVHQRVKSDQAKHESEVWIMGTTVPVKLMPGEFEHITE